MKNVKSPKKRLIIRTLGDWQAAYMASESCPAQANMVGVFRRFAELVGDISDPQVVEIKRAEGLLHYWLRDVQRRHERGELSKASAAQYRSWGRRAIEWAVQHLRLRAGRRDLEFLQELDAERCGHVDWLRQHGKKIEYQRVRHFYRWLDEQGHTLKDLLADGDITQRYAHEALEASGIQTWQMYYTASMRGIRRLQQAGMLREFPIYQIGKVFSSYGLSWLDFPHPILRQKAETFYRVASDETAFAERSGRVIRPATRDGRLAALGSYIGFLVRVCQEDLAVMEMDAIWERERIKRFAAFLLERQGGQVTQGIQATLKEVGRMAHQLYGVPKERFDRLLNPRQVVVPSKRGRVPTLDEYHALVEQIGRAMDDPANTRLKIQRNVLGRLQIMLLVLGDVPLRVGTLCTLRLEQNLYKPPGGRQWWLQCGADEVKGKRPFQCALSSYIVPYIDRYLEHMRPNIIGDNSSDFVFPTRSGAAMSPTYFERILQLWDRRLRGTPYGQTFSPHRVRDMVSHTCTAYMPQKGALVAATLLQHAHIKTLDRYYLDEVGRSYVQRNERLYRWVEKEDITNEELDQIVAEMKEEPREWHRFVNAVSSLE
jgi:integrase